MPPQTPERVTHVQVTLTVIKYDDVVPNGTAVGCQSEVTIRGAGFLANGRDTPPVTCSFGTTDSANATTAPTAATVVNDTAITCRTIPPTSSGILPLRVNWGTGMSDAHPVAAPAFRSFEHTANQIHSVRPGAGSYQDTATVNIYGIFEDYGQPACRFGSWFSSWAVVMSSTHVRCEKPPFPASERGITGAYPVFFTGNRQCAAGATQPSNELVGSAASFRTYNAQINGLSRGASPDSYHAPLSVYGVGIVYPSVVDAICRFTQVQRNCHGNGWIDSPASGAMGVIITHATAMSDTELQCAVPDVTVPNCIVRYTIETLQNGVNIDPTSEGVPFTCVNREPHQCHSCPSSVCVGTLDGKAAPPDITHLLAMLTGTTSTTFRGQGRRAFRPERDHPGRAQVLQSPPQTSSITAMGSLSA